MKPFSISQRDLGAGRLLIEIRGELDMAVADQAKAALRAAMAEYGEILVALGECEFIDSTGVATLLLARNAFAENDGRLVLCEPIDQVRRVLELSGMKEDDFVFESFDAALARSDSRLA